MGPASRNLRQEITYWAPASTGEWGHTTFDAPVKIRGRWSEQQETVTKSTGDEFVSKAIAWVSQEVEQGGYLALGDHTQPVPVLDPTTVADAWEVQAYRELPDLRNLEQERKAYM